MPSCSARPRYLLSPTFFALLSLGGGITLGACGSEDPTALRLRLVSDPVLNTEAQVAAQLSQLELVLSASGGFANLAASTTRVGAFEVTDSDKDGRPELLWRRSLSAAVELPELRVTPGENGSRSLAIAAFGRKGSTVVAAGSVSSITFSSGSERDVDIPFNLHAAFRPPRVVLSSPHDGQTVPPAISQVVVEFSRMVQLSGTTSNGAPDNATGLRLVYQSGSDRPVGTSWKLSATTVQEGGISHQRSLATLLIPCTLNGGTYRLEATSEITDTTGQHLDQHAANGGLDAFVARFTIPGTPPPSGEPCATTVTYCKNDQGCQPQEQFTCAIPFGSLEGKCVPRTDCGAIQCEKGFVCLNAGTDATAQCVPDCRLYGCDGKGLCSQKSGLCEACDPNNTDPNCAPPPPPPPVDVCKDKCADTCQKSQPDCDACLKNCANGA